MNVFKALDSLFPTLGKGRLYGEVVGVVLRFGGLEGQLEWKRKAYYVNASVNAFHMHRGLVREFMGIYAREFPKSDVPVVKRMIALCILNSYIANHASGEQWNSYLIENPVPFSGQLGCWWVKDADRLDYREIVDDRSATITTVVGRAVDAYSLKTSR